MRSKLAFGRDLQVSHVGNGWEDAETSSNFLVRSFKVLFWERILKQPVQRLSPFQCSVILAHGPSAYRTVRNC